MQYKLETGSRGFVLCCGQDGGVGVTQVRISPQVLVELDKSLFVHLPVLVKELLLLRQHCFGYKSKIHPFLLHCIGQLRKYHKISGSKYSMRNINIFESAICNADK